MKPSQVPAVLYAIAQELALDAVKLPAKTFPRRWAIVEISLLKQSPRI